MTVSTVPKVASTIMSPNTQPKKTGWKIAHGIMSNAAIAPTPNKPETRLASNTPMGSHVSHVFVLNSGLKDYQTDA